MAENVSLLDLTNLNNGPSVVASINANNAAITTALADTLSRSGTSPNQMSSSLDMNSNQILNLPSPATPNSPVRLTDINSTLIPTPAILSGSNVYTGNNSFTGTTTLAATTFSGTNNFTGASTFTASPTFNATTTFNNPVTFNSDVFFKGGRPWTDVRAWGAVGDNVTSDTTAIQNAINYMNTTYGGGIVYFPPGNYYSPGGLLLKGSVRLVGESRRITSIHSRDVDVHVISFDAASTYAGLEDLFVQGYQNQASTHSAVFVPNAVVVYIINCDLWGGQQGLQTSGVNGHYINCFISGFTNCVVSTGAEWFVGCTFDFVAGTPSSCVAIGAYYQPGVVGENHFTNCDLSGNFSNSVNIDDGSGTQAVTTFVGCVLSSRVIITNARVTMFTANEVSNATFNCGTNPTVLTGNAALGAPIVVSGAGKVVSGNYNIS